MCKSKSALSILIAMLIGVSTSAKAESLNQILGTWRMVTAQIDPDSKNLPAYGSKPNGLLVFTEDMHFIEVLTDATIPKFASDVRGQGTAEENRAAMAGSIGFFGTYTVDKEGVFSGNRVEASTFPNWIGQVRTRKELRLVVEGDRMTENFQRPDGTRIRIIWQRVKDVPIDRPVPAIR
ncbi:lipocalin-like domain-containing protein [Massilia timonae]|uniref:lipocalin-like domain-containing protein n=1 Tax=Massilia timonae TaxID=47229 RepID=UPI0028A1B56B|nr:lipocalin-like domain-containing protein [Massilia timonae]